MVHAALERLIAPETGGIRCSKMAPEGFVKVAH
jgi:hypothetical protein